MAELTLQFIQSAIEKSGAPWKAADNPITRLPREDQLRRLGVAPPPGATTMAEALKAIRAVVRAGVPGIPASHDLRNVGGANYVTPIKDQSNCGSCVAFGACATVESTHAWVNKVASPKLDLSEAQLFFCHAEGEGQSCDTGWWPSKAYSYFSGAGIADEKCYRYQLPSDHCSGRCADWKSRATTIRSATPLKGVDAIRQWLATHGPVSACFIVYDDFMSYSSGIYRHTTGNEAGGHCICIVGYDDQRSCWICKNSWGTGWGENGFFRIEYGQCAMETWEVHGVRDVAIP